MKATFISKEELKVGDETSLGTVKSIEWSASRKTVKITVTNHQGVEFTDRTSAVAKIAVFK